MGYLPRTRPGYGKVHVAVQLRSSSGATTGNHLKNVDREFGERVMERLLGNDSCCWSDTDGCVETECGEFVESAVVRALPHRPVFCPFCGAVVTEQEVAE